MQDILSWWPKVKKGGILAGHDYIEAMTGYYAVQEFGRKMNLPVFSTNGIFGANKEMINGPSWYILKP